METDTQKNKKTNINSLDNAFVTFAPMTSFNKLASIYEL